MKSRPEYENDIPIDDELTVLDLLRPRWGDHTDRFISLWQRISSSGEARILSAYKPHEPVVWGFSAEEWLERRRWG